MNRIYRYSAHAPAEAGVVSSPPIGSRAVRIARPFSIAVIIALGAIGYTSPVAADGPVQSSFASSFTDFAIPAFLAFSIYLDGAYSGTQRDFLTRMARLSEPPRMSLSMTYSMRMERFSCGRPVQI